MIDQLHNTRCSSRAFERTSTNIHIHTCVKGPHDIKAIWISLLISVFNFLLIWVPLLSQPLEKERIQSGCTDAQPHLLSFLFFSLSSYHSLFRQRDNLKQQKEESTYAASSNYLYILRKNIFFLFAGALHPSRSARIHVSVKGTSPTAAKGGIFANRRSLSFLFLSSWLRAKLSSAPLSNKKRLKKGNEKREHAYTKAKKQIRIVTVSLLLLFLLYSQIH